MNILYKIPEPLLFNALKHHLCYIREFTDIKSNDEPSARMKEITRELKHIGTSVMDVYTGDLSVKEICHGVTDFLTNKNLTEREVFLHWTGAGTDDFKVISLTDGSQWVIKYYDQERRFVHIFPARSSPHTFRIKSNTLKSAILYITHIGKDLITDDDLNKARALAGLSPVKEVADSEAVAELIEVLRN
jgi:hypothetical protein